MMTRWTLPTRHLAREVRVFDALDSTNSHALALADDPELHGLAILAREQSAGRGQYGRVWSSPPDTSVLLSILLFPPPEARRPVVLTAWAAVAVCELVAEVADLDATIKWPNDILVRGKKVCGILIEQRTSPHAAVVGIGLNVNQPAEFFAAADLPFAASLGSLSGRILAMEPIARALLHRLDDGYASLLAGRMDELEARWRTRLGLTNQMVEVECANQVHRGRLVEASFAGVVLETDGELLHFAPESVRHLTLVM